MLCYYNNIVNQQSSTVLHGLLLSRYYYRSVSCDHKPILMLGNVFQSNLCLPIRSAMPTDMAAFTCGGHMGRVCMIHTPCPYAGAQQHLMTVVPGQWYLDTGGGVYTVP